MKEESSREKLVLFALERARLCYIFICWRTHSCFIGASESPRSRLHVCDDQAAPEIEVVHENLVYTFTPRKGCLRQ